MSTPYYERKPTRLGDVVCGEAVILRTFKGYVLPGGVHTESCTDAMRAARIVDMEMRRGKSAVGVTAVFGALI